LVYLSQKNRRSVFPTWLYTILGRRFEDAPISHVAVSAANRQVDNYRRTYVRTFRPCSFAPTSADANNVWNVRRILFWSRTVHVSRFPTLRVRFTRPALTKPIVFLLPTSSSDLFRVRSVNDAIPIRLPDETVFAATVVLVYDTASLVRYSFWFCFSVLRIYVVRRVFNRSKHSRSTDAAPPYRSQEHVSRRVMDEGSKPTNRIYFFRLPGCLMSRRVR